MTKLYHKHCFGFVTLNIGLTRKCLFYRKLLVVISCGLRVFLCLFANAAMGIIVIWIVAFRKRILFNCDFIIIKIFSYSSNMIIFHEEKYLFLVLILLMRIFLFSSLLRFSHKYRFFRIYLSLNRMINNPKIILLKNI